jgi:hypothetical protein
MVVDDHCKNIAQLKGINWSIFLCKLTVSGRSTSTTARRRDKIKKKRREKCRLT